VGLADVLQILLVDLEVEISSNSEDIIMMMMERRNKRSEHD